MAHKNFPPHPGYYLTQTAEDKWGIAYWDGVKWWSDEQQDKKTMFGIKYEWIKAWHPLPTEEKVYSENEKAILLLKCMLESTTAFFAYEEQDGTITAGTYGKEDTGKDLQTIADKTSAMLLRLTEYYLKQDYADRDVSVAPLVRVITEAAIRIPELREKIKAGILKTEIIRDERRCGNTTRLVDYYIQQIFDNPGKEISPCDHAQRPNNDMNRFLSETVYKRLQNEHPWQMQFITYIGLTFKYQPK